MKLTAEMIEGFAGVYLSSRYDSPQPTPPFHRECWRRYCSDVTACATAAPRNHAKSTGLTHDFILANVCFRAESYVILLGASEEMAIEHLGDIANELSENEDLRRDFHIKDFVTQQKTDIIVQCTDGYEFRIVARGAEQKIRGRKWKGRRPGLIVGDDLEDDEQVENKDRRRKFRRWFFRAAKQALRDGGRIRVHGTILHEDSLLANLTIRLKKSWNSRIYKAHKGFDDFSEILWPEKFPEKRLRGIRDEMVSLGDAAGYSQEYLNDPMDNDEAYIRKCDMLPMKDEAKGINFHTKPMIFGVGVDLAISKADTANKTSFTVGGKDIDNIMSVVDQRSARMDSLEIIEEFFSVNERWSPDMFWVEDGQIWKAIWPMLKAEMQIRDIWLSIEAITPLKDKAVRGRAYQKRSKAGGMRYDKEADWYPIYEAIILKFTGTHDAVQDDEFDSTALLARGFEEFKLVEKEDFETDEEQEFNHHARKYNEEVGRSQVTGY